MTPITHLHHWGRFWHALEWMWLGILLVTFSAAFLAALAIVVLGQGWPQAGLLSVAAAAAGALLLQRLGRRP